MRTSTILCSLFGLALALSLAACGDDSGTTAPDMSANGQTCVQIVGCIQNCGSTDQATCAMTCASKGSSKAQGEYNAGIACGYGVCTKPGDGGATACTSSTDTSSGCLGCILDAVQSSACATQLNACLSGT